MAQPVPSAPPAPQAVVLPAPPVATAKDLQDERAHIARLEADNARLKSDLAIAQRENARLKKDLSDAMDDNALLKDLAARKPR